MHTVYDIPERRYSIKVEGGASIVLFKFKGTEKEQILSIDLN